MFSFNSMKMERVKVLCLLFAVAAAHVTGNNF